MSGWADSTVLDMYFDRISTCGANSKSVNPANWARISPVLYVAIEISEFKLESPACSNSWNGYSHKTQD
jgi:hypothetical protein